MKSEVRGCNHERGGMELARVNNEVGGCGGAGWPARYSIRDRKRVFGCEGGVGSR